MNTAAVCESKPIYVTSSHVASRLVCLSKDKFDALCFGVSQLSKTAKSFVLYCGPIFYLFDITVKDDKVMLHNFTRFASA